MSAEHKKKNCFMDADRPCDLTCKAAFEVDDPVDNVDNVDCYFIWLAHHFGEGVFSLRGLVEHMGGGPLSPPGTPGAGGGPGGGPTGGTSGPGGFPGFGGGPKGPKGFPNN